MTSGADDPWTGARRSGGTGLPSIAMLAAAMLWILAMLVVAILADHLAPFGYAEQNLLARLRPDWTLWLDGGHNEAAGREVGEPVAG